MGSITHLEDLPTSEFLDTVETLGLKQATEKLDGANLYFGFDAESGKLFTSREGKRSSARRVFSADDYPYFSGTNPFRAAHLALESVQTTLQQVMDEGQTVEIEVLFGRQPNAITYGADNKSYIAFLQAVNGTPSEVVDKLTQALLGTTTEVTTKVVSSEDGANIDLGDQTTTFEFIGPQFVPLNQVTANQDFQNLLTSFNNFLNAPVQGLPDSMGEVTNGELDAMSMSSVKVVDRETVKPIKAKIQAEILTKFKLPIKKFILGEISSHKSKLQASDLDASEDLGIEGVVLRDPTSGNLTKVVDKTMFTAINSFNHTVRGQISGTVKTIDETAPLESRGGIVGHMKIQVAKALGMPELARAGQAKKIIPEYAIDDNPVNTVKEFAKALDVKDFQGKKRFIAAIISQALKDLDTLRKEFVENRDEYSLNLGDGKVVGISPEIARRTMLSFAEAQVDLVELLEKVKNSKTLEGMLAVLYGFAVPRAQQSDETDDGAEVMAEAKRVTKKSVKKTNSSREDNDVKRFAGKDAWSLINIYFATVFLSTLMYKTQDRLGMRMLMDKSNFRMTGIQPSMSPVNFWGYPIWKSGTTNVKKLIGSKAAKEIHRVVKRIPPAWFKFLHMDLSSGRDVPVNWADHAKTLVALQQFPGMKFDRITYLIKGILGYETLTFDQKVKVLNTLNLYVAQFIPNSPLYVRMKAIQRNLLINPNDLDSIMTLEEFVKPRTLINLKTEDVGAGDIAAGDIAPNPSSIFGGKVKPNVVKRKRNPNIKHLAFKKPENSAV